MKIFNWVHKRFHHKDGFASNMKNTEPPPINNADGQALLKQVADTDLLGGWKDGILTIGTLGYDPLKTLNQHKEYYALESEDEIDEDDREHVVVEGDDDKDNYNAEHEELNPLMHTTFQHNFEDVVNVNKEEVVMTFNEVVWTPLPVISHDEVMETKEVELSDQNKKKGERITLADLFLADSDVKMMKLDPAKALLQYSSEKSSLKAKRALSFPKKLIPRVKDNPHPVKDIKKLMKKLLKRKIHPDLDVKNHKPEALKASAAGIIDSHEHEANDTTSLLAI